MPHQRIDGVVNRNCVYLQRCVGIVILSVVTVPALAGYAKFTPTLKVETLNDDNINLVADQEDSAWQTTTAVQGKGDYLTETSTVSGDLKWENIGYSGGKNLDNRDDLTLKLHGKHSDERNAWLITGIAIEDSTRKDIIDAEGEDVGSDVGRIQDDITRNRLYIIPEWVYRLTDNRHTQLRYKYSDLQYDDSKNTGLVDAYNHNLTATYFTRLNEHFQLIPSLSANYYESEDNDKFEFIVGRLAGERVYDDAFSTRSSLGVYHLDADTPEVNDTDVDLLYEVSAMYSTETTDFTVVAERILGPGDFGNVITRDQFKVTLNGIFNPSWGYNLNARYYKNRSIIKEINDSNRRYTALKASLLWQFSESFNLDIGYRFRTEKENGAAKAESNAVFLSISYQAEFTK